MTSSCRHALIAGGAAMNETDVVAVAWIDEDDAEMLKAAGRIKTILYCVSFVGALPLYSQATVDETQERIDELEAQLFISNADAALPVYKVMDICDAMSLPPLPEFPSIRSS